MVENLTTGRRICVNRATYGSGMLADSVTSMSTCSWDSLGVVHKGDRLRMTTFYDAPRPLHGVMGIVGLSVYETNDVAGGTAAPAAMRRGPDTEVPSGVATEAWSPLPAMSTGHDGTRSPRHHH